jgi:hypothetical protein
MTVEAPAMTRPYARQRDRQFYTGMAIAIVAAVFVGFSPTYYLRSRFTEDPLPFFLHVHGFIFSTWIVFFLLQTALVASRRTGIHRKVGWIGVGLALAMVVAGTTAGILSGRGTVAAGYADESFTFLTTPLLSMVMFSTLVGAAIMSRAQPELHKRLLLLATISILDAPIARWPVDMIARSNWAHYVATDLFIVAAIAYDLLSRRRVHPAYLWGGLLIVVEQAVRTPIGQTETWHAIARGIIGGGP